MLDPGERSIARWIVRCSPRWVVSGMLLLGGAAQAGQIPSAEFFGLRRGMSESEILVRAGIPDMVTTPGFETIEVRGGLVHDRKAGRRVPFETFRRTWTPVIERWHYVPGPEEFDPHLTIITFRGGEVWEIDRTKVFSRASLPQTPAIESGSDAEIAAPARDPRIERLDKTIQAAEDYADTRRRLMDEGREHDATAPREPGARATVYRKVQPDGSTYYGDAPPGATFKIVDVE